MISGVFSDSPYEVEGGKFAVVVSVPSEKIGLVIGKKGSVVKEIITQSGALLKVIIIIKYATDYYPWVACTHVSPL